MSEYNDKYLSVFLALAQRNFTKADILYSVAKDTIFVYDKGVQIAQIVGGKLVKDYPLWNEERSIQEVSDEIEMEKPTKPSNLKSVVDKIQVPYTQFVWKNATWEDCFDALLEPRKQIRKSSLSSLEVLRLMRKRIVKKNLLHTRVSKKDFEKMHRLVRVNFATKKNQAKKTKQQLSQHFKSSKIVRSSENSKLKPQF